MSLENLEVWENFIPSKTVEECEHSRKGHIFIEYKRIYFRCYICGITINRRF